MGSIEAVIVVVRSVKGTGHKNQGKKLRDMRLKGVKFKKIMRALGKT